MRKHESIESDEKIERDTFICVPRYVVRQHHGKVLLFDAEKGRRKGVREIEFCAETCRPQAGANAMNPADNLIYPRRGL